MIIYRHGNDDWSLHFGEDNRITLGYRGDPVVCVYLVLCTGTIYNRVKFKKLLLWRLYELYE